MKTNISKLVILASQYQEYGREMKFPDTFTELGDNNEVKVYFNGYDVCSVKLEDVDVVLYSGKIIISFDADEKKLERIYNKCAKLLTDLKTKGKSTIEERIKKEKEQRIAKLRSQLESIQNELKNMEGN